MGNCKYEKDGHCLLNECLYGDFLERDDSRFDTGRYCWKPDDKVEYEPETQSKESDE